MKENIQDIEVQQEWEREKSKKEVTIKLTETGVQIA